MPPCPHCHELPKEQRGTVTSHMWSNAPFRVAGIGDPEFYVAYQYLCQGCPAVVVEGAPKVKKANGNFFLATHPKLIEIMDSQGLSWATSYLRAVKGERVGLELMLGELMARGVVKSGNIKDYADMLQELQTISYYQKFNTYLDFIGTLQQLNQSSSSGSKGRQLTLQQTLARSKQAAAAADALAAARSAAAVAAAKAVEIQAAAVEAQTHAAATAAAVVAAEQALQAATGQEAAAAAAAAPQPSSGLPLAADTRGVPQLFLKKEEIPSGTVSQTFITRSGIVAYYEKHRQYIRSFLASFSSDIAAVDFQFQPVKSVMSNDATKFSVAGPAAAGVPNSSAAASAAAVAGLSMPEACVAPLSGRQQQVDVDQAVAVATGLEKMTVLPDAADAVAAASSAAAAPPVAGAVAAGAAMPTAPAAADPSSSAFARLMQGKPAAMGNGKAKQGASKTSAQPKGYQCKECRVQGHTKAVDGVAAPVMCKDPPDLHHSSCYRSGQQEHVMPKSGAAAVTFKGKPKGGK